MPGRMSRRTVVTALVFGLFVFIGVAFLLARTLTASGTERGKVLDVLRAQARGDAAAVLEQMPECRAEPACARLVRERAGSLAAPGRVQILQYQPARTGLAFDQQRGVGRVAWRAGTGAPVVQCVRVLRQGPLSGGGVQVLSVSDPIARDGSCA